MSRAPVQHVETCISVSPASPSLVLHINTTPETSLGLFGAGRKRGFEEISGLDEEAYARKYLATEGSVFFRRKGRTPRSFLWRVLEDRKLLEIQCVDLVHDKKAAKSESGLTFRVQLPAAIVRNGVVFADPEDVDSLEAYVLTASNELYTITLKRDLLTRETAPSEFDASTCVKKYSSNSLAFRHPYKLVAVSGLELFITLHDGGILRLARQPNENGTHWRETFYSEGNWGDTIRGLITLKRHQTVRYGDLELEPSAVAALAESPDGRHVWTVTLDHELKAWSTTTGKPIAHIDMLNQRFDEETKKLQKYVMSAEQGTLMQLVTLPTTSKRLTKSDQDLLYYIVLRSPKDNQFKFYEVSAPHSAGEEEESIRLDPMQTAATLIPPFAELMDTTMWHLEEFHVIPGPLWRDSQIWIRARNGKLCKTFTLTFSLWEKKGEAADLEPVWQNEWTSVDASMQTAEALRNCTDFPGDLEGGNENISTLPTEKWVDFLFSPGRFSTASIDTALSIYRKGRGLQAKSRIKGLSAPEVPLKERVTEAIGSKIVLKRHSTDQPDYERYQSSIQTEWKTFYSLLRDLHTRRHEAVGLALDTVDGLAWTVYADFVASIRATSQFEALVVNEHLLEGNGLQLVDESISTSIFPSNEAVHFAQVLSATKEFCSRLSPEFKEQFNNDVLLGALEDDTGDRQRSQKRVQDLYDTHDFSVEVMDDDFLALEHAAQPFGGLGDLSEAGILGVLELMQEDANNSGADPGKALSLYGNKMTIAIARETLEQHRSVLLSLLTLVVFMYGDLDQADLHPEFLSEIGPLYDAIATRLKHNVMLSWLARNTIAVPQAENTHGTKVDSITVTLLERLFIGDWDPKSKPKETLSEQLTKWSKQWTYGARLWDEWDGVTGHVLGFLIQQQSYELATDFQVFLSRGEESSSWLQYLEGRLLLATGEYAQASLKFQAAAGGMAEATKVAGSDTAHLLSAEEQNYFGDGHSRFYQHISALYEKLRIFSYTADFATLALDHLENGEDIGARSLMEIDRRKANPESPAHQRVGGALEEIDILKEYERRKEEIRGRLFTAQVETGRFAEALRTLSSIAERAIRHANLSTLIRTCIQKDAVPTLLALPFADTDVLQDADAILLSLAKKSLASGTGGGSNSISSTGATTPHYQILYAFRTQNSDFRGAAEILYAHLQRLRDAHAKQGILDPEEQTLVQAYVLLINTLACCGEGEGWLLADPLEGTEGKRRLVTLADVRAEYTAELDRRSEVLQGRFPLFAGVGGAGLGEEMDVF
ncbi:nucleoporin Nup120/160-domain-containing protein [Neohortaea acidophila]|uniref:Nucleoporin Nup120/160-domain-containing protein n=1 Tax=Neohortaea acidophila TaxID=245834 RepID=A0A6A6PWZ5_9PEZI|nr:nucleoporin Nup120/160-domain-containing protein [Neohortaea acidophila]KAF2484271.1 nucleoporin Nup120/160-domain-containing protein [Neohortaea acidophila]